VRIGLVLPLFSGDPKRVLGFARAAEEAGYQGLFAFDHFFPPGAPPDKPSLEAFTTLATIATVTQRVAVGTLVTRASLRPVGLLAKLAAGIDDLSGGRMLLGLGTGDAIDEPEHRAFGLPTLSVKERRVHLEETILAAKALFRGGGWEGGDHVPAIPGPLLPPPVTEGGPPIWVGGLADEVVRLAGRLADGWNGWGLHLPEFTRKVAVLSETAAQTGRRCDPTWAGIVVVGRDDVEAGQMLARRAERGMLETNVWAGSVDAFVTFLTGLRRAGATWAIVAPAGPSDRMEMIARTVLPQVAGRT